MENKCETITHDHSKCGKEAKYKVTTKMGRIISFLVCEDCIPAYNYVQGKEYGNNESNFIVEELNDAKRGKRE